MLGNKIRDKYAGASNTSNCRTDYRSYRDRVKSRTKVRCGGERQREARENQSAAMDCLIKKESRARRVYKLFLLKLAYKRQNALAA